MSDDRKSKEFHHQHKGKTSEARLDKKIILAALNIVSGQKIIDAGCGNGYMAKEFVQLVKPDGIIYALDIDHEVIDKLSAENIANILPMTADITHPLDIDSASIDLIYVSTVFHGFSHIQISDFIVQVKRLLKPDAVLAILEMKKKVSDFGPPLGIRVSPDELKQLIGLAPGKMVEINDDFYMQLFINKPV